MTTYTWPRSGQRPLKFEGELILDETSNAESVSRYWHCAIAQLNDQSLVLQLQWITQRDGETGKHEALALSSREAAADWLENIDPLENLDGFPSNDKYADKQARLEKQIKDGWNAMLTRIFDTLGVVETLE